MNRSSASDFSGHKVFSFKAVAGLGVVTCLFVAALVLLAGPASACCTAVVCPYAISSSSQCVGGPNMPVCNTFGCNCNTQCGMYTATTNLTCVFSGTCSSDAANAPQARFDEIDADHDGKISLAEADAWAGKQKDWTKNVKTKDLKGAGKDEAGIVKAGFAKADKNHDGSITPAEFDSSLGSAPKK
jgi:Ca2+-binding EF-hand superfamily protein